MSTGLRCRLRGSAAALAALALLSACDSGRDARRAEICRRTLPALVAAETGPEIGHVGRGATRDVVRIDFRMTGASDKGTKPHWLLCRFEPDGDTLAAVTTDRGPVTGASLYLLRHYYLDPPSGTGAGHRDR